MREDNEKTQADISEFLGVSRQQYGRWESNSNEISLHHMVALARYYGVSMDYLSGIIDIPKSL